jgi:hypothetical protein
METATIEKVPYRPAGQFGFTRSTSLFNAVQQYISDAVADGWDIKPTYGSEPVERAASLTRDGFHMLIINRSESNGKKPGDWFSESSIHIWGPDGMAIRPPEFYDFEKIKALTAKCPQCGAEGVKTVRYAFAGRCCEACLPAMRAKHEKPGWCD